MNMYSTLFVLSSCLVQVLSLSSCGIDNSPVSAVYEGQARIETYPWLGILYYPYLNKRLTTAVVLVTRQIALGAATEIDKLPKESFRARARVLLGRNCSGGHSVGVRDYTYHPDYSTTTYSALAIIQLETDETTIDLRPICAPPTHFNNPQFYAMVLSEDCKKSRIMLHKMKYVSPEDCKSYYRRSGLDLDTMWPTHTACAKSVTGGRCVWRSGAILTVKIGKRWRLLGFGVYGPGCQAPARFLDYGMYHKWVQRSVSRIGRPAITTLDDNHIVLRRMLSNVQRYGPCDREETATQLYTDTNDISFKAGVIRYNLSLYANVEYHCVNFRADYEISGDSKPKVRLRRWCSGPTSLCYGFGFISIDFYVEIEYIYRVRFKVSAYGREAKLIDPLQAVKYVNKPLKRPEIPIYNETLKDIKKKKFLIDYWYLPGIRTTTTPPTTTTPATTTFCLDCVPA